MKFPTEWKNNIMFQTTNQMQTSVTVTLPEVSVLGGNSTSQAATPGRIFKFALERLQPITCLNNMREGS